MTNLKTFINEEFGTIRTLSINNEPWFIAKDVCNILDINNSRQAMTRLEPFEKNTVILNDGNKGNPNTTIINESGFYALVLSSRKPIAKPFRLWITQEVIPQIRKTGGYIPISQDDDELTIMSKAHLILERTIEQKNELISTLQPKADTYDRIMSTDGTFSMNQVAKQVGMGEYHLFAYLRGQKVLFYEGNDNVPYERFRKNGYFRVIDTVSPDGYSHSTTRVTQKGIDYIVKLLRKDGEVA